MPTVGPELPPHLAKRKRDAEDEEGPSSPPTKIQAASPKPSSTKRVLGPSLPPGLSGGEADSGSESDSEGPALPQATITTSASAPAPAPTLSPAASNSQSQPRRVLGPAPPPASLDERPAGNPNPEASDDDSDSDDYGPRPPGENDIVTSQFSTNSNFDDPSLMSTAAAPKPQRDEWMLAPPTSGDWTSRVDPTKLKNRKFASGRGAGAPSNGGGGEISSIWTETPEQKRQRLADEVLGRRAAGGAGEDEAKKKKKAATASSMAQDEATARRIAEYDAKIRGRSLVEQHQAKSGKTEDDDPSKRAFDREKDMAIGGQLSDKKRREMLSKAATSFGDRFSKGSFL